MSFEHWANDFAKQIGEQLRIKQIAEAKRQTFEERYAHWLKVMGREKVWSKRVEGVFVNEMADVDDATTLQLQRIMAGKYEND